MGCLTAYKRSKIGTQAREIVIRILALSGAKHVWGQKLEGSRKQVGGEERWHLLDHNAEK